MKKFWFGVNLVLVRLRFLMIFVVVGLIVGNWGLIMNVAGKLLPRGGVQVSGDVEYFCPMDPGVLRDAPANCPICGMPLSKRKKGEAPKKDPGIVHRLQLSPYRIAQAGVATEEVTYQLLVREIGAVGFIEPDERKIYDVTTRVAGRIEKLYRNFTGQFIKAGESYASLYSPELLTTQEDYLRAGKGSDETSKRLAEAARKRLDLWGITADQIQELEKSGQASPSIDIRSPYTGVIRATEVHVGHWLEMGAHVYEVMDLSTVWMQAAVFETDLGLVKEGLGVDIRSEAYPDRAFAGKVVFISPTVDTATRTAKVRVDVENPGLELKPGMYVTAKLKLPIGQMKEVFYGC